MLTGMLPAHEADRVAALAAEAFDGIENVNLARNREPLAKAAKRLRSQARIPIHGATLGILAERIIELRREVLRLRDEAGEQYGL